VNGQGAIATLLFGLLMGTFRIASELMTSPGDTGFIADFAAINFSHMAILMFVLCVVKFGNSCTE